MDKVYLLYEGDEWLSNDSMVLMGVFTNTNELYKAAKELVEQRIDEHRDIAKGKYGFDKDATEEEVIEEILIELFSRHATSAWPTNYSFVEVETNKLEEI